MRVLIIGGTGLISTGIAKHLRTRKAGITFFNRGERRPGALENIQQIHGDRNRFAEFEQTFKNSRYDVVIDMICGKPEQAESVVRAFSGRCEHFLFCSTVCTYGTDIPPQVVVDESFTPVNTSDYGVNKRACEIIFKKAQDAGQFKITNVRPSCTYGPGNELIDPLQMRPPSWDRIERGLPVLCHGDGLGLWVATHRDDCGKFFAYAALNPKTYGEDYNATRDENFTWRDYIRQAAAALGKKAHVIFMPADWIVQHDPKRFGLLDTITRFHGAFSSEKAKRDVPEFRGNKLGFQEGAAQTFADQRQRNVWRSCDGDQLYEAMIQKALAAGVKPVIA